MLWLKSLYFSTYKNAIRLIKNDNLYFLPGLFNFHVVRTSFGPE